MASDNFWHKQTPDKPLFPDVLWSRPETKQTAGKLLIVGGNSQGFTAPAQAYNEARQAGIGSTRVILPEHVKKLLPSSFLDMEFTPGTPSGSFAQTSLADLLDKAGWSNGVLLAGDFGRNAETAILLEKFTQKYTGQLTLAQDAIDYFFSSPQLSWRPNTALVVTLAQLQKLATTFHFATAFTSKLDFLRFVDTLHDFTVQFPLSIVISHLDTTFVAVNGQVSTTKPASNKNQVAISARAAVWWLQHPNKTFEAITSSLI